MAVEWEAVPGVGQCPGSLKLAATSGQVVQLVGASSPYAQIRVRVRASVRAHTGINQ